MTERNLKIKPSGFAAVLLVIFPYVIALGAYSHTNTINIMIFLIIALIFFWVNPKKVLRFRKDKLLLRPWILLICVGLVSTLFFQQYDGLKMIYADVSFTVICYVLCSYIDPKKYFNYLRWSVLLLAALGLLVFLFDIDVFAFKNSLGMVYSSVDKSSGGGISTLFEFRHYYGLYLVAALFIQFRYPFKDLYSQLLALGLLGINIVLTYTRSVWIVLIACALFWIAKNYTGKLSSKAVKNAAFSLLAIFVFALIAIVLYSDDIFAVISNIGIRMDVFDISDKYFGGVRLYVLQDGFRYIFDNRRYLILGGGGGFALQWLQQHPFGRWGEWSSSLDVQYVTTFMDYGIIGLFFLLLIVKKSITSFFRSKDNDNVLVSFIMIYFIFILLFYDVIGAVISAFPLWCVCLCLLRKECEN